MSDEKMYLVTYEYRTSDMEDIDKVIVSEEEVRKLGDDTRKAHATVVESKYYLRQDRGDWEEEYGNNEEAYEDRAAERRDNDGDEYARWCGEG